MNLDDPIALADRDPSNVIYGISTHPDRCAEASAIGTAVGAGIGTPNRVSIVSDPPILAEILASIVAPCADIPVAVGTAGRHIGDISLLIAIDLTSKLELLEEALAASSSLSDVVVAITSGDSSIADAESDTKRVIRLPGLNQHSCGLAAVVAGLSALAAAGVVPGFSADIAAGIGFLRQQARAYAFPVLYDENPAKRLALLLSGRLPFILGSNASCDLIGRYWRGRMSRYAKIMAVATGFDEVRHEMVGWRNAIRQSDRWSVVAIRDRRDAADSAIEFDSALDSIVDDIPVHEVYADGGSQIERVFAGMYFGEFVAGYLALMWNEDPGGS